MRCYGRAVPLLAGILAIQAIQAIQAIHTDRKTLKEAIPAYAIASNLDILDGSSQCRTDMKRFRDGVDSGTLWSLRMLDASGEPGSGYTEGNNNWVGKVHQCNFLASNTTQPLSARVRQNNSLYRDPLTEYPPFNIQFYAVRMLQNSTMQYHVEVVNENLVLLGLCLPSSCRKDEIGVLMEKVLRDRNLLVSQLYAADFKLIEVSDLTDDHQWLLSGKIILIIFILLFAVGLVIVGTLYDFLVYQKRLRQKKELLAYENNNTAELKIDAETKQESGHEPSKFSDVTPETKLGKIIMCFSAYSNTKRLFETKSPSDSLLMFHGLKFYGMLWIIIGHTVYFSGAFVGNRSIMYMTTDTIVTQIISNATYSVDTFFCISGFLLTYAYLQAQKKEKAVSWQKSLTHFYMMFLKRYIRLTPAYAIIIMISILNYSWHERTSIYQYNERVSDLCSKYWWRNLLYINNFYNWSDLCLSWSWYLTNDMQFFVFGSFLLVLANMYKYLSLSLGVLSLFGSIFITGYLGYTIEYYPMLNEIYSSLNTLYARPWTRVPPFLVGMLTGVILIRCNRKLHLSKKAKVLGWTFGIICNLCVLLGPGFGEPSFTASIFYLSLARTAWGFGIMWLIIACLTDNGGIINKFLSLRAWIPLSRLTYTFYLVNPFLISSIYLLSGYPLYTDVIMTGASSLGILVASYACALVLSLVGEIPAILLLRLLFSPDRRMK